MQVRVVHACAPPARLRKAVAATELAITLPLILLFIFACCDFGRIAHHHLVVSNAARCGAETGASRQFNPYTFNDWQTDVRTAVVQELSNLDGFDQADLQFSVTTTPAAGGIVIVAVDVAYPFHSLVNWPALPSNVILREHIEFSQFR